MPLAVQLLLLAFVIVVVNGIVIWFALIDGKRQTAEYNRHFPPDSRARG